MEEVNKQNVLIQRVSLFALWIVTAMLIFHADDPYELKMVFLLLPMFFMRQTSVSISWIDVAVGLLWLHDLTGCLTGINSIQTVHSFGDSVLCLLGYLAIRQISGNRTNIQLLLKGLCLLTSIAVLLALFSFFVFQHSIQSAGFKELYSFRFLFNPLGYATNSWSTVLIAILGIILVTYRSYFTSKITRRLLCLFFAITISAILLSFSRGAYVTLIVYSVLLLLCTKSNIHKLRILGFSLLFGGIICYFFQKDVQTTLLMNTTVSQQQSNKGRIQASQTALNVFKEHMIHGVGKGNYTLAVDKQLNQDSTVGYTSYAPNIIVQWGIEKGILGILLYLFLAFCIGIELWKRRKSDIAIIAGCTLFAIFVKEMSLGTITSTPVCTFICALLLAIVQQPNTTVTKLQQSKNGKLWYGLLAIINISYIIFFIFILRHYFSENYQKESYYAYHKGDYKEAIRLIEQTERQVPYLICRAITYMKCFELNPNSLYLEKAEYFLEDARMKMPEDLYIEYLQTRLWKMKGEEDKAYKKLKKLASTYPKNALYHKDLSCLLYNRDKKDKAIFHLEKAIRLYPSILNMKSIKYLERTDNIFYQSLKKALMRMDSGTAPTDYARYGYILYYCGDKVNAEQYLMKAISALPNLSTPWYLLGEIKRAQHKESEAELCMKKFCLLTKGAFQFSSSSADKNKIKDAEYNDLIQVYAFKFKDWYMSTIYAMLL